MVMQQWEKKDISLVYVRWFGIFFLSLSQNIYNDDSIVGGLISDRYLVAPPSSLTIQNRNGDKIMVNSK